MNALWPFVGAIGILLAILAGRVWRWSGRLTARRRPDEEASPADLGLDYQEIGFDSRDGVPLRGWFIPAERARGTVVLCHGHAGSMDPDVVYAPWFHEAGFNVLQFDFRAHGRSGGERVSFGALEWQDLLGAVAYLAERGIAGVGVLGFSMGGAVALASAARSEAIRAVVSDGGYARLESAVVGWARERTSLPTWLVRLIARLVVLVAGWRVGASLSAADPIRWVGRIAPRPVLFIHGDRDVFVSVAEVEALYTAAGEPKELWRVAGAEHRRVDEVRPDEYRERVIGFFRAHLAGQ